MSKSLKPNEVKIDSPLARVIRNRASLIRLAQLTFETSGAGAAKAVTSIKSSDDIATLIEAARSGTYNYGSDIVEQGDGSWTWPDLQEALAKAAGEGEQKPAAKKPATKKPAAKKTRSAPAKSAAAKDEPVSQEAGADLFSRLDTMFREFGDALDERLKDGLEANVDSLRGDVEGLRGAVEDLRSLAVLNINGTRASIGLQLHVLEVVRVYGEAISADYELYDGTEHDHDSSIDDAVAFLSMTESEGDYELDDQEGEEESGEVVEEVVEEEVVEEEVVEEEVVEEEVVEEERGETPGEDYSDFEALDSEEAKKEYLASYSLEDLQEMATHYGIPGAKKKAFKPILVRLIISKSS